MSNPVPKSNSGSEPGPEPNSAPAPLPLLPPEAMTEVSPSQLPPLDAGMVNVTGDAQLTMHNAQLTMHNVQLGGGGADDVSQAGGYRMVLLSANSEYQITIPYDPSLLPQGFTEDDIQTYVYDQQYHRWVAIQRDSVNMEELLVCSRFRPWEKALPGNQEDMSNPQDVLAQVQGMMSMNAQGDGGGDSPLDFINAVLKTPEMPETSAYTPTSIKELKAADPLEGLTLMQPPTANNSGTANMSYPIEIPAGRQGMQPNLALTYNSSGGNGWLGVGWDISIPSITVETRWGVPRYDSDEESEVYVYEGEQLVSKDANGEFRKMRHRTNEYLQRQSGHVQFWPRKNEVFDSIVRHGSGPDSYWWTVTHKNGVTDYYGCYAADNGVNNSCVLRTGDNNTSGAIAHWALAESVDPFGNSVRYYYDVVFQDVTGVSGVLGKQIYPSRVQYTNISSEQGYYKIVFNRREDERQDVVVSANRGFVEVTSATLCNIGVLYDNIIFREYNFFYENGRNTNFKTRLSDVLRIDKIHRKSFGCLDEIQDIDNLGERNYTRTHFDYYDAPQGNEMFGKGYKMSLDEDGIHSFFITNPANIGGECDATALGATRGKSWNIGGTASVGLGPNVCLTSVSVGGNFSYSRSESEGALTLVDLDGDGLADKLFKDGEKLVYRPQIVIDDTTFIFGDTVHINGISSFLKESSSTTSWGLQASAFLAYNGSWPTTKSTTNVYLSDVNGDGLPDLITDGGVLFNVTERGGRVRFNNYYTMVVENQNSGNVADTNIVYTAIDTCQGIIFDGAVSDSIICYVNWVIDTFFHAKDYNNQLPQEVLDYADSLHGMDDYWCLYRYSTQPLRVTEIFIYKKEMECLPIFSSQSSNSSIVTIPDPDMETVRVWVPQKAGSMNIHSRFRLLSDTTGGVSQSKWRDGVSYAIQICRNVTVDNDYVLHATSYDTVLSKYVDKNCFAPQDTTISVSVGLNDLVFFRLISGENHAYDKVSWQQTITYSRGSIDHYGVPDNYYDSNRDYVVSGRNHFAVPLDENDAYIRVSAKIRTSTPYYNNLFQGYILRVEALRTDANNNNTTTIANYKCDIQNNMPPSQVFLTKNGSQYIPVQQEDFVVFYLEKKPATPSSRKFDWSEVEIIPHVEYYLLRNGHYVKQQDYYPPVNMLIENYEETRRDSVYHTLFGPLYRGWGQFAYNNNDTTGGKTIHDDYIHVDKLIVDMDMFPRTESRANVGKGKIKGFHNHITHDTENPQESSTMLSCYETAEVYNPISKATSWIEMQPDSKNQAWIGYGNINYLTGTVMSNDRLPEYAADTNTMNIVEYDHPVPIIQGHDVKTIRKQNISRMKNHSLSLSAPMVPISVGMSHSAGENIILTDYMDLNGDRYPDIVGQSLVQYSNPWGGIGDPVVIGPMANGITKSETTSSGKTFGGSFQMPTRGTSNNPKNSKISFDGSGNPGFDYGGGNDETALTWMDVNGDGLPDKVSIDHYGNGYVCLNTGYDFKPQVRWGNFKIRNGNSFNEGFSFGTNFNIGQASIGGGLGLNFSNNSTMKSLMDINGDGLPDMVEEGDNHHRVNYNLGGGNWSGWEHLSAISNISYGTSYSESANASLTLGFTFFSILKVCVGISGSPYNRTFSKDMAQLTDINGDGYVDYVTSNGEGQMTVRYNKSSKANLLRRVTNFTGSTIDLDYEMPQSTFEKPQRSWNLSEVRVRNNDTLCPVGGNQTYTKFEYEHPNYNRVERMDYGYDRVVTYQYDTEGDDSLYRYTVEEYDNQNFTKRGRKTRDCMYDAEGNPYIEHLYDATVYDLTNREVTDGGCARTDVYVAKEVDITNYFEGQTSAQITSMVQRWYDQKRNVTEYIHYGDTTHNDEFFKAEITYASGMSYNLASLPSQIIVKNHSDATLQRRTATYDSRGKLIQLVRYNNSSANAQYDFTYDTCGNLSYVILPANANGQRIEYRYQYDSVVHTYPILVENMSLGYQSSARYDFMYGKPTQTVDINGNTMTYIYDAAGRNTVILAPYEIDSGRPYTIKMEYYPKNYGRINIFGNDTTQNFARTFHYDPQHPTDDITTTLLSDGLGRMLQTKKDAEFNGQEWSIVTGKVKYDCFGRTVGQYHPFMEDTALYSSFNPYYNPNTLTKTEYDVLDRQLRVELPTGDTTRYTYDFGTLYGQQYFKTTVTDALGNTVTTLSGSLGQKLQETTSGSVTKFTYDPIGQLLSTTDPNDFSTTYSYDMLGRMTQRTHPDAGTDTFVYDAAGNMTSHTNGKGDVAQYDYYYNQLTDVSYPAYSANNVHYTYGAMGAAHNRAGKIVTQEDASGWQEFFYGKMGEVTKNIRTFALPYEAKTYTFAMEYEYDSWNRIQNMTYPDGEVVSYEYNKGGMLQRVTGMKNNQSHTYIDSLLYNKFELKERVLYGNGTKSCYHYDILLRMDTLWSWNGTASHNPMQAIAYTYDGVGNITNITNSAAKINGIGGPYHVDYTYDGLYRMTHAEGWHGSESNFYDMQMGYYPNGRIQHKKLTCPDICCRNCICIYDNGYNYVSGNRLNRIEPLPIPTVQPGGGTVAPEPGTGSGDPTTVQINYDYSFQWDGAGNMMRQTDNIHNSVRQLSWDAENRLQGVKDNAYLSLYQYDANGERTYKLTGSYVAQNRSGVWRSYYSLTNATLYASPYLVATVKGYTKHYYAENERIASRIGDGGLSRIDTPIVDLTLCTWKLSANSTYFDTVAQNRLSAPNYITTNLLDTLYHWKIPHGNTEPDCYWYHPDHLGSASWVTSSNGDVVQYLYYLPWGEDYLNQRRNGYAGARHTFSAKEKDTETGLSYFGSRYYSSDLSIWLSVDPMSDKYPSLSPYVYCANNPIKLVDPNGEEFVMNDDIVIRGANNSSVTIKTDLIDIEVNVTSLGIDFGGNYSISGNEVLSAALDLAGIIDPSGIADGVNMVLQAKDGEFGGAFLSAIGLIPYVGDLAKSGKICKDIKILKKNIEQLKAPSPGLGNPFKNKSLKEINDGFQEYVQKGKLVPARGSAPGNKAYVNTKSGYSYNLDPGNATEASHVDINYPHGVNQPKKKLPAGGGF